MQTCQKVVGKFDPFTDAAGVVHQFDRLCNKPTRFHMVDNGKGDGTAHRKYDQFCPEHMTDDQPQMTMYLKVGYVIDPNKIVSEIMSINGVTSCEVASVANTATVNSTHAEDDKPA